MIQLEQKRYQEAAKRLKRLHTQHQQAMTQARMLDDYVTDYRDRFLGSVRQGMTSAEYGNFRGFIASLDSAVSQQSQAITQLSERMAQQRQLWTQAQRRTRAFQTLLQRQFQHERKRQLRMEQREHDEASSRTNGFAAMRT